MSEVKIELSEAAANEGLTFETGIGRLEQIVKALEQKDVALEAALNLFREGVELVQHCNHLLNQAEREMEILLEGPGGELTVEAASFKTEG